MDGGPGPAGLIGPNAILQLVPVLERVGGRALRHQVFASAGVFEMPSGEEMVPEGAVARVHRAVRRQVPGLAAVIAAETGARTGDYILAHRIPAGAQRLLRALPAPLAARLLTRAIARHAWTFAGSGRFEVASHRPPAFLIHDNPLVRGEHGRDCLCHWHAAVFERLFRALVRPRATVRETECRGAGAEACRFEVKLG